MGDGPAEGDGDVGGRRKVTAYHNKGRIPLPVPCEWSDDDMEFLGEFGDKVAHAAIF